jgi:hypothetical protein
VIFESNKAVIGLFCTSKIKLVHLFRFRFLDRLPEEPRHPTEVMKLPI